MPFFSKNGRGSTPSILENEINKENGLDKYNLSDILYL